MWISLLDARSRASQLCAFAANTNESGICVCVDLDLIFIATTGPLRATPVGAPAGASLGFVFGCWCGGWLRVLFVVRCAGWSVAVAELLRGLL